MAALPQEQVKAIKLIEKSGFAFCEQVNNMCDGYVPTIKDKKVADAIKSLGYRCWNPATGNNW